MSDMTIEIWAGDLGAYNGGDLIGDWVNVLECVDLDDLREKVATVTGHSEEFHICDSEAPFPVERYTSLDHIWEMAQIIGDARDSDAMAGYLAYHGWDLSMAGSFEDAYCGEADSLEYYALDYYEDCYGTLNVPGFRIEVDLSAWESDYFVVDIPSGGCHIFRSV